MKIYLSEIKKYDDSTRIFDKITDQVQEDCINNSQTPISQVAGEI